MGFFKNEVSPWLEKRFQQNGDGKKIGQENKNIYDGFSVIMKAFPIIFPKTFLHILSITKIPIDNWKKSAIIFIIKKNEKSEKEGG